MGPETDARVCRDGADAAGWLGGERKSLKRCKANGVLDVCGWAVGLARDCEGEPKQLLKESSSW